MAHIGFNFQIVSDRMTLNVREGRNTLYTFQTPEQMHIGVEKNDKECGFDVLGFKFCGTNSLQMFSMFYQNLIA